jgi:hypothetical protein
MNGVKLVYYFRDLRSGLYIFTYWGRHTQRDKGDNSTLSTTNRFGAPKKIRARNLLLLYVEYVNVAIG